MVSDNRGSTLEKPKRLSSPLERLGEPYKRTPVAPASPRNGWIERKRTIATQMGTSLVPARKGNKDAWKWEIGWTQ